MNIIPLNSAEHDELALSHDLLTPEREADLVKRAQRGDARAMDELLAYNQRLIHTHAKKYYSSGAAGSQELSDLMQWGRMGFITAVQEFRYDRAQRLSTYATWWIRAYLNRYGVRQGNSMHLSYQRTHRLSVITRIRASLTQRLKREPTPEEVYAEARKLGKKVRDLSEVESLMRYQRSLTSLDKPIKMRGTNQGLVEGDTTLGETIPDDAVEVEDEALTGAMISRMLDLVADLPEQHRLLLQYRYWENLSQTETGARLGISVTTVSNLEKSIIQFLKCRLEDDHNGQRNLF